MYFFFNKKIHSVFLHAFVEMILIVNEQIGFLTKNGNEKENKYSHDLQKKPSDQ